MCKADAKHQTLGQCSQNQASSNDSHSHVEVAAPQRGPQLPETRNTLDLSRSLSVFLLDWDDTLCPTTALSSLGPALLGETLKAVDSIVAELITTILAIPNGRLIILTNANITWVFHSAESFMPKVNALLGAQQGRVLLISAHRDKSQLPEAGTPAYEDAVRRQKSEAVRPLAVALRNAVEESQAQSLQVISIGDQPHDLAAGHTLQHLICTDSSSASPEESFVKTVLMKSRPTGMELVKQLSTLCRSLPKLVSMSRSLHQSMSPTQAPAAATPPQCGAAQPTCDAACDVVQSEHEADARPSPSAMSNGSTCASDTIGEICNSRPVERQYKVCA